MRCFALLLLLSVVLFTSAACKKSTPNSAATDNSESKYVESGKALHANGDYAAAISEFTKAIEVNPRSASAYNHRGNSKRAKKR